ncbi:MAG: hypothetical protein ACI9U2_004446 [Bradymonadia bacterium]|jgi:hypothetical protein
MFIAFMLIGLFGISTPTVAPMSSGGRVAFVQGGATPHLLIERRPGAKCAGAPDAFVARHTAVRCPIEIDAGLATRWLGQTVELYGGAGVCMAEVVDLHLLAWFDVNFGHDGTWFGEISFDAQTSGPPSSLLKAALARAPAEDRFLSAALKVNDAKACDGARWARIGDTTPSKIEAQHTVKPRVRTAALARFRAHPGHRAMQERYRAETDYMTDKQPTHWDAFDGGRPQVTVFQSGKQTYVYVGAMVGGCGDFGADFWVIYARVGSKWVVIADADQVGGFIAPQIMIVGEAGPLFADHTMLIAPNGPVYEVVEDVDVATYICPC